MNISKQSWHYRFFDFVNDDSFYDSSYHPRNLCPYFWSLVFCVFKFIFAIALSAGIGIVIGLFIIWIPIASLYYGVEFSFENYPLWFIIGVIASVIIGLMLIGIVIASLGLIIDYISDKPKGGLFFKCLKAKKEKLCPILEFKD